MVGVKTGVFCGVGVSVGVRAGADGFSFSEQLINKIKITAKSVKNADFFLTVHHPVCFFSS